ncbi:hypothetical protein CRM95_01080 [Burkholderia gladioli]|nr:hypothetical protein CRM95_01080 [Burkholderia gladioli]
MGSNDFSSWTNGRSIKSFGTNAGAKPIPFQEWHKFKEAFAPELIAFAVESSAIPVKRILDPFGGSGTTSLAAQFLDIHPITSEVNPFLADVIEAKLTSYDTDELVRDLGIVARMSKRRKRSPHKYFAHCPETFIEPGKNGRWIFNEKIAARIAGILSSIETLPDHHHQRLFRIILSGLLIRFSNVRISGKGRRYRTSIDAHSVTPDELLYKFCDSVKKAIVEIHTHARRRGKSFDLLRGDSRELLTTLDPVDLIVFSPPYPNSFDYTDVYNIELWMLGYLKESAQNRALRMATLSSHVQIHRNFSPAPTESKTLKRTLSSLNGAREILWDAALPEMVGAYFSDMTKILQDCYTTLRKKGALWMVVGDSRYANIHIDVPKILCELAPALGYRVDSTEPFRSMRSSPQQGGRKELAESLVILSKD